MGDLNIYGIYDTCKDDPQVNNTQNELDQLAQCSNIGGGGGRRALQVSRLLSYQSAACEY